MLRAAKEEVKWLEVGEEMKTCTFCSAQAQHSIVHLQRPSETCHQESNRKHLQNIKTHTAHGT